MKYQLIDILYNQVFFSGFPENNMQVRKYSIEAAI